MQPRIYTHPTQAKADIPSVDLLTLLFDSEHSAAEEDSVLHVDAASADNTVTKAQLRDLTERIAHGLQSNYALSSVGPKKDVVTVITYGQILVPALLYGVIAAGAVYSAASPSSTVAELSRQVEIGQSRLIVCGEEHKDLAAQVAKAKHLPLRNVLLLDSTAGTWSLRSLDSTVNAIGQNKLKWQRITDPQALKESLIVILWSSGTTGLPKGVMLSHLNLVAETYLMALSGRAYVAQETEKGTYVPKQHSTLAHLPVSHIAGLFGYLISPFYSAVIVIWMRRYVWDDLLKYLKQHRITVWYTVPSIWLRISKSPEMWPLLKSLEGASTGAAPMDGDLMKTVNSIVGTGDQKMIGQTWGMSETTGAVTAARRDQEGDDTGCLGDILPSVELRMVDDDYKDVDPDKQEGEMLVRSPLVSNGYYNNPQATKDTFHGEWLCTGDIAVKKNDRFYIVDRKKELLKYKGLQVAPAEIENLLFTHPHIREAAVVGVPAPNDPGTDWPRAYVVRAAGEQLSEGEVQKYVADRLAPYKQLRGGVAFINELPKNAIGKFLRRELRERAKSEVLSQASARQSKL
ncbi:4-coumarate-CoA ligase [Neohortaea acidophila]|uniref:4-coumarate-CoA ligase n=1 Tax=Neohortaea acidophila TaxID=245834 RepID=A0A6A6Q107_9PEZI|nr:4-coumarate-CoA ligase [Neohortaea acidophila]KAF2486168.1 4-coumarate-CoA ligase [Neohortaea acidophila]